ncbi:EcsC family protein [Bacillus massilinigeriensis]|uniref:EcsC family protein n=1 Tax=Bacillus mediterraneensis TaxID=1805474 RepID=UPI0008F96F9C|nr:EcsC family protein [Bacillus mediterraneensis]
MHFSDREQKVLNGLKEWENALAEYQPNDFEQIYHQYVDRSFALLPEGIQERFFGMMDGWLFHLHALIQGSQLQTDARERILSAGRIFQPDIETVEDMRELSLEQMEYIATLQISRHRLYSFLQGGSAGSGGSLMLGADIPAMAVINLRAVQLVAMSYGFEVNTPFEMMAALKVFHVAMMPKRMQSAGWDELMRDLRKAEDFYFYHGREEITNPSWLEQPLKQVFKGIAILFFRKKKLSGFPLISMGIGAGVNYQMTRKVTDFAHRYYQARYFFRKGLTED